ncbi:hypothetical protein PLUA15_470139 [Pseudomonas lundensis]|uniref:Uncharacterized protein n=1 Tax=Pseudomonas lundensis TaxID=86185 RepID=A0AAX2HCB6_9PSED|nr:hypothetical protein PLUA15_470139 [Pseudomonas lundensis]
MVNDAGALEHIVLSVPGVIAETS